MVTFYDCKLQKYLLLKNSTLSGKMIRVSGNIPYFS